MPAKLSVRIRLSQFFLKDALYCTICFGKIYVGVPMSLSNCRSFNQLSRRAVKTLIVAYYVR